jgi:hypothetical protein
MLLRPNSLAFGAFFCPRSVAPALLCDIITELGAAIYQPAHQPSVNQSPRRDSCAIRQIAQREAVMSCPAPKRGNRNAKRRSYALLSNEQLAVFVWFFRVMSRQRFCSDPY